MLSESLRHGFVSRHGQDIQLYPEKQNQQQPNQKVWNGYACKGNDHYGAVGELTVLFCRQHAKRDANADCNQKRKYCDVEGRPKVVFNHIHHGFIAEGGCSEVSPERLFYPVHILNRKRIIQPHGLPQVLNLLLCRLVAQDCPCRVAGCQMNNDKNDNRNDKQNRNQ